MATINVKGSPAGNAGGVGVHEAHGREAGWLEARLQCDLVGQMTGVLGLWPDGLVCGHLVSTMTIPRNNRDAVARILMRENLREGDVVWEFGSRGRVVLRVKGIQLHGNIAVWQKAAVEKVADRLAAMDRRIGALFAAEE